MEPTTDDALLEPLTDGKVIMGLAPMAFGWRVRAGLVTDRMWYHLDWCCGDSPLIVWSTYELMKTLLLKYDIKQLPPHSQIKPWPKDEKFTATLVELLRVGWEVSPHTMLVLPRPSLAQLKLDYYTKIGLTK